MKIIGHRGAPKEAFENSWSSFQKSIEIGCDRIELDIYPSKDGVLFVVHDDDLMRSTGQNVCLSKLTSVEVKKLVLRNDEKIPRLDKVLEYFLPRIELNIEIKYTEEEHLDALINLIDQSPYKHKIVLSSFDIDPLIYMQKKRPDLRRALLTDDCIPEKTFDLLQIHKMYAFHPRWDSLNENVARKCAERAIVVCPWIPLRSIEDSLPEIIWDYLWNMNVDGICTNYPRQLKSWLARRSYLGKKWE